MQQIILIAVAVAAPFLTWGLSDLKAKWIDIPAAERSAADKATAAEHDRGVNACNARVEGIRQQIADASEEARKLAEEAEASMQATPEEKAARQAMCNADSMCRARKQGE